MKTQKSLLIQFPNAMHRDYHETGIANNGGSVVTDIFSTACPEVQVEGYRIEFGDGSVEIVSGSALFVYREFNKK